MPFVNPTAGPRACAFLHLHLQVSRAAPRTISLPSSLQPLAAANWLLACIQRAPEYQQQQQQQGQQQHHQQQHVGFSSWKYRDPAVLTVQGLEASVRQVCVCSGRNKGRGLAWARPHLVQLSPAGLVSQWQQTLSGASVLPIYSLAPTTLFLHALPFLPPSLRRCCS